MNLDGGGEFEVVVDYESANKSVLAIDWMGRNMYWTVANRNCIDMAQIDGKLRSTFLYENIEKPIKSIALFRLSFEKRGASSLLIRVWRHRRGAIKSNCHRVCFEKQR